MTEKEKTMIIEKILLKFQYAGGYMNYAQRLHDGEPLSFSRYMDGLKKMIGRALDHDPSECWWAVVHDTMVFRDNFNRIWLFGVSAKTRISLEDIGKMKISSKEMEDPELEKAEYITPTEISRELPAAIMEHVCNSEPKEKEVYINVPMAFEEDVIDIESMMQVKPLFREEEQ